LGGWESWKVGAFIQKMDGQREEVIEG